MVRNSRSHRGGIGKRANASSGELSTGTFPSIVTDLDMATTETMMLHVENTYTERIIFTTKFMPLKVLPEVVLPLHIPHSIVHHLEVHHKTVE